MSLRKQIQFAVGVVVVSLLTLGFFLGLASYKRTQAQSLLRSITQLKLGTSTFEDAQHLAENYSGRPWSGVSRKVSCSSQNCDFRFVFENKPLRYIPGVRSVEFVALLIVKDGHVVSRELDYSILTPSYYEFMYLMDDNVKSTGVRDYEVKKLKQDAQGVVHVLKVSLGPLATSEEKERAYSVDLSCLARLRDCSTPSAVFPPGL